MTLTKHLLFTFNYQVRNTKSADEMLYLWTKKQMEGKKGQTDRQPLLFNMEFVRIEFIHIIIDMQVLAEKLVPALGLVMAACDAVYFLQHASCKYII